MSLSYNRFLICLFGLILLLQSRSISITDKAGETNYIYNGTLGLSLESYYAKYDNNLYLSSIYLKQNQNPLIMNINHYSNLTYKNDLYVYSRINVRKNFSENHLSTIGYIPRDISLFDELRMPYNIFNIGIDYDFLKISFGSQSPEYSDLTLGGLNIFGVGGKIESKYLRFSAVYGTSQVGFAPYSYNIDTVSIYVPGAYDKYVLGLKMGIGNKEKFCVDFNVVKSSDKISDFLPDSTIRPTESLNFSIATAMKFDRKFGANIEGAVSVYTADFTSPNLDINDPANQNLDTNTVEYKLIQHDPIRKLQDENPVLAPFISLSTNLLEHNVRTTTSFSYAASTEWYYNERLWALKLNSELIGLGYKTPGFYYSYLNDYLNSSLSFRISNETRKLNITSRFGLRINNFTDKNEFSTSSLFGHVYLNYRFNKDLKIDLSAMNYNLFSEKQIINNFYSRDSLLNRDLVRLINMVSTNFRLTPAYNFTIRDIEFQSRLNLSYEYFTNNSQQGIKAQDIFSDRYNGLVSLSTELPKKRQVRASFGYDNNPKQHSIYRTTIGGNFPIESINTKASLDISWNNTTYEETITINNFIIQPNFTYTYDDKTNISLRGIIKIGENAKRSQLDWIKGNYFENSIFFNFNRKL